MKVKFDKAPFSYAIEKLSTYEMKQKKQQELFPQEYYEQRLNIYS